MRPGTRSTGASACVARRLLLPALLLLGGACVGPGSSAAGAAPGSRPPFHTFVGAPAGGLPYRLHVPAGATARRPAPLVVWLHPGWALDNDEVERLTSAFARRGHALLVPSQPLSVRGWSAAEAASLMTVTLPEVGLRREVEASTPVLLGHGAGGDQALSLWLNEPCRYRGIALSSALPLSQLTERLEPCADLAPVLTVLGERDRAARAWRTAESEWRAAGVRLTVGIARHRGYKEWLFEGAQAELLLRWLDTLAPAPSAAATSHPLLGHARQRETEARCGA